MLKILIIYFSKHGGVAAMAEQIRHGIDANPACESVLRCLPPVSADSEQSLPGIPDQGVSYAELSDVEDCDGLILGSPGYFGNMASPLKYFLDLTSKLWLSGKLVGKPAGVFTATSSMHGGQESVLLSMMLPLLHHGMLISGIPYSEPSLHKTQSGATPYGASHVSGPEGKALSDDEISACRALGRRIADVATALNRR